MKHRNDTSPAIPNPRPAFMVGALLSSSLLAAETAPRQLVDKLGSLAGPGSRDCGTAAVKEPLDAVFACAEAAAESGGAYRLALEFEGPDGRSWQGVARDARGKLWTVYFDSDPAAPPGTGDTVSVVPCSAVRLDAKGEDVIRCSPILGR